jgi:hypothetical protein
MRFPAHPIARALLGGALIGFVILGGGGRLVMAAITAKAGGTPRFTLGGTGTVLMLGAASGLAAAVLALISRVVAARLTPRQRWTQYLLFGLLLYLVTMRGLHGTAQPGSGYFYLLVAAYAVAFIAWVDPAGVRTDRPVAQSQEPIPLDRE